MAGANSKKRDVVQRGCLWVARLRALADQVFGGNRANREADGLDQGYVQGEHAGAQRCRIAVECPIERIGRN